MRYLLFFFLFLLSISAYSVNKPDDNIIRVYQDADLSNNFESSEAIQNGIEVAFDEINNQFSNYKVEFKYLNNNGSIVRSKRNYEIFLADPRALAIYSGIHSPPLIKNRSYINENRALTFVPWAAGGPITRYPSSENWIFRLSVDDARAGSVIVDYVINEKQCRSPHLLLEATSWGDSNFKSMSAALIKHGISVPQVTRFRWNLKAQKARFILREIAANASDCIILVANAIEGVVIAQAMIDLPVSSKLPIISHWGITGGSFHEKITAKKRQNIDLSFIQSCFAFTNEQQSDFSRQVFDRLKKISGSKIKQVVDLESAVGFIHAYDLTKILIQAIKQVGLTGDINTDRDAVRLALENLKTPVRGLIKVYDKPFTSFDPIKNVNAHEALHSEYYCMAHYGSQDEILIVQTIRK